MRDSPPHRLTLSLSLLVAVTVAFLFVCPDASAQQADLTRDFEEVVLTGGDLPAFQGQPSDRIHLYRYDASSGTFQAIPFQIDAKGKVDLDKKCTWYDWGGYSNCEVNYLFDNNGAAVTSPLDDNDEIVFLARDVGDRVPDNNTWLPANVSTIRYEIRVDDTRVDANGDPVTFGSGWVYAYLWAENHSPAFPAPHYVTWSSSILPRGSGQGSETTCIQSLGDNPVRAATACGHFEGVAAKLGGLPTYKMNFLGNWIINRIILEPDTATSNEILDRFKMRAIGPQSETENLWSTVGCAVHHGTKLGPVRVIYVTQGAASGPATTNTVLLYPSHMRQRFMLRVHGGLQELRAHFDLLSSTTGSKIYVKSVPDVAADSVDGTPQSGPFGQAGDWTQLSTADGRIVEFFEETRPYGPPRQYFYRDDSSVADAPEFEPGSWGDFGWYWVGPTPDKQDRVCIPEDDPTALYARIDRTIFFRAGNTDRGTDPDLLEQYMAYPLRHIVSRQDRTYPIPPPPPPPTCQPEANLSYTSNGHFTDIAPQVPVGQDCGTSVTAFNIYRSRGLGAYRFLTSVPTGQAHRDYSVIRDQTYSYIVRAVNVDGAEGPASQQVTVLINDTEAPPAPTGVAAQASDGTLQLTWNPVSVWDMKGYHVYLATVSGGPYMRVTATPVPAGTETYAVTGLSNGQTYWAVVKALDWGGNESSPSAEVSGTPTP